MLQSFITKNGDRPLVCLHSLLRFRLGKLIDYRGQYWIPGITWSDKEWQGSALDPINGFRRYYNIEGAYEKVDSETSFLRLNAQWKYVSLFAPKHRFVSRLELGYIFARNDGEALSPSLRFYGGGDQSIRGFAYQSVGPEVEVSDDSNVTKKIITELLLIFLITS